MFERAGVWMTDDGDAGRALTSAGEAVQPPRHELLVDHAVRLGVGGKDFALEGSIGRVVSR